MLGLLNEQQIDHILHSEMIGRIGCSSSERTYIIPVTYVYHQGYIYAHSKEGLKIQLMRTNAKVCFQVDAIDSMTNWRSVLAWGTYEELKSPREQDNAFTILNNRLGPYSLSESVLPSKHIPAQAPGKRFRAIAYRIKVSEKVGRFEKT